MNDVLGNRIDREQQSIFCRNIIEPISVMSVVVVVVVVVIRRLFDVIDKMFRTNRNRRCLCIERVDG
jgi:hypothetical protein